MLPNPQLAQVDDPRLPIDKLRRVQLRAICLSKGIALPGPFPPATIMRHLIEAEGGLDEVLGRNDKPVHKLGGGLDKRSEALVRVGLEKATMIEVRRLCGENGVPWKPTDKKAALIELLIGHEN